jgi:uncharacterized DUF497 family protein
MRLLEDAALAEWLQRLTGAPEDFEWDAGNRTKHLKHRVQPTDVQGMFQKRTLFLGRIVEPAHDEERGLLLGQAPDGRPLALIFTRRGEQLRPISCRPMRSNERKLYEEACTEDH